MEDKLKANIIFITGGARSGKSNYAQEQALSLSSNPYYIATAKIHENDEEFKQRVQRHKSDRDERWTSLEESLYISKLSLNGKTVVIDCVTLWLTNFFSLCKYDVESSLKAIKDEFEALQKIHATFFIISNEIGRNGCACSNRDRQKIYRSAGMDKSAHCKDGKQSYTNGKWNTCTHGESYEEFYQRIIIEFEQIVHGYRAPVAIVSHGGCHKLCGTCGQVPRLWGVASTHKANARQTPRRQFYLVQEKCVITQGRECMYQRK